MNQCLAEAEKYKDRLERQCTDDMSGFIEGRGVKGIAEGRRNQRCKLPGAEMVFIWLGGLRNQAGGGERSL